MAKEQALARQIVTLVGGRNNIQAATHCMTRLRLTLIDPSRADMTALKQLDGILGVVGNAEQWQIVLGPGFVTQVAREVNTLLEQQAPPAIAERPSQHAGGIKPMLRTLANVFVPLIPAIVASGMLMGVMSAIQYMGTPVAVGGAGDRHEGSIGHGVAHIGWAVSTGKEHRPSERLER